MQTKFVITIFNHNGNYYIDNKEVQHGKTTEFVRDKMLREHFPNSQYIQQLIGIVRVQFEAQSHLHYHFVYYVRSKAQAWEQPKRVKSLYQESLYRYIYEHFIDGSLNYHEVQYDALTSSSSTLDLAAHGRSCVLIGSYRKHFTQMQRVLKLFNDEGIHVLSPKQGEVVNPSSDFILLDYDPEILSDGEIQAIVLKKMDKTNFTYLVNPNGYLGMSASFEIGYGIAKGIKMFCMEPIREMHQHFVRHIYTPGDILRDWYKHFPTDVMGVAYSRGESGSRY